MRPSSPGLLPMSLSLARARALHCSLSLSPRHRLTILGPRQVLQGDGPATDEVPLPGKVEKGEE